MHKFNLLGIDDKPMKKINLNGFERVLGDSGPLKYFKRYGTFTFTMTEINGLSTADVEFQHSASVTVLIAKYKHNIHGKKYTVETVDGQKQLNMLIESLDKSNQHRHSNIVAAPGHESPLNILNMLCDDCIQEIFERLPLRDLCSVAETCVKFKENAKKVFSTRFNKIDVAWLSNDGQTNPEPFAKSLNRPISIGLVEQLFRNFGDQMTEVCIDLSDIGFGYNHEVWTLMLTYLTGKNAVLSDLGVSNFAICNQLIDELKPLFARLSHLSVSEIDKCSVKRMLRSARNVTKLTLDAVSFHPIHKQRFENLEDIELICVDGLSNEKLFEFMTSNPRLRRLVICDPFFRLSWSTYRNMATTLPLLEHIEIDPVIKIRKDSASDLVPLAKLNHLKTLRLNCFELPIDNLLNGIVEAQLSITDLTLKQLKLDANSASIIPKLANVHTMRLFETDCTDIRHLSGMVKKMPNLKHLFFDSLNQWDFKEIVNLIKGGQTLSKLYLAKQDHAVVDLAKFNMLLNCVKQRDNGIGLKLTIFGKGLQIIVPADILKSTRSWLDVEMVKIDEGDTSDDHIVMEMVLLDAGDIAVLMIL